MLRLASTIRSVWLKTGNFCLELCRSQDLCKNHRFYWERAVVPSERGPRGAHPWMPPGAPVLGSPLSLPSLCRMLSSQSFMGETPRGVQWPTLRVLEAGGPGLLLGLGRSPGEGNGYPLQYSCLENSVNSEDSQNRFTKSLT